MTNSIYLNHGSRNEQLVLQDIIEESIKHMGVTMYYLPREVVGKDEILGEDRSSRFQKAMALQVYLESNDGWGGGGPFMSKFGLQLEQSATLTVGRRGWEKAVGRFGVTNIPGRPLEGDLLWFPITDTLLEIKFVQHDAVFYQLGKLYTYQLEVETFQYSSEHIDTGISSIDAFESLKSYDTDPERTEFGGVAQFEIIDPGSHYAVEPLVTIIGDGQGAEAVAIINDGRVVGFDIIHSGYGFNDLESITVEIEPPTNPAGTQAIVRVSKIETNPDMSHSYGDNTKFKKQSKDVLFSEENPFGELK